ncbi:hypothetical protein MTO96_001038 [Rhipicephalus appendiculatus]
MRAPPRLQGRCSGPTLPLALYEKKPSRALATCLLAIPRQPDQAARRLCSPQRHDCRLLQDVADCKSDTTNSSCCSAPVFAATA